MLDPVGRVILCSDALRFGDVTRSGTTGPLDHDLGSGHDLVSAASRCSPDLPGRGRE